MPERSARVETLRAGRPIRVGSVVLLPIERAVVRAGGGTLHAWLSAAKEPHALIVRDASGLRAVDAGGAPVALDELREGVPGLDALLASM